MPNLFFSEWTKLRSTASFWWTSGLLVLIPVALAGLLASSVPYFSAVPVVMLTAVTTSIIVTVQAAMAVTTDYRYGLPATTFRLTPVRWRVAAVKFLLYAAVAALLTCLALVVSYTLGGAVAGGGSVFGWASDPAATRALWALPLAAAGVALLSQGLGWLTRNTAGAITLVFALEFVLESVVGLLPKLGEHVARYTPFSNLYAFMFNAPAGGFTVAESFGVFLMWALGLWIAGLVVLELRDA